MTPRRRLNGTLSASVWGAVMLLLLSSGPILADEIANWIKVGPEESAIAFLIKEDTRDHEFVLSGNGKPIDSVLWKYDQAFLKQYRVIPGYYGLNIPDAGVKMSLMARAGEMTIIKLGGLKDLSADHPLKFSLIQDRPADAYFAVIKGDIEKDVDWNLAGPTIIYPSAKEIKFEIRPPWQIPPKPDEDEGAK